MRLNELCPLLAACLLGSITGVTSFAVPSDRHGFSLAKRQDEANTDGEVEADSTGKLRSCK